MGTRVVPLPRDRVILHFDYDCFYASVFESEDPSLRSLPFAVQQKQICVTASISRQNAQENRPNAERTVQIMWPEAEAFTSYSWSKTQSVCVQI